MDVLAEEHKIYMANRVMSTIEIACDGDLAGRAPHRSWFTVEEMENMARAAGAAAPAAQNGACDY